MSDPPAAAPYVFDLDGGRACLDFANTSGSSGEHLDSYAALLAFASQSDLLTPDVLARLHAHALADPLAAETVVARARVLRDALRRLFQAVANEAAPTSEDLGLLNAGLAASLSHARVIVATTAHARSVVAKGVNAGLVAADTGDAGSVAAEAADAGGVAAQTGGGHSVVAGTALTYGWGWSLDQDALWAPLWPLARSAADVLTSDQARPLVRKCGACNWLFLDTTRNRSRQWCSMQSCGNREKARRHYQRLKAQRTGDPPPEPADAPPRAPRRARQTAAAPVDAASATAD